MAEPVQEPVQLVVSEAMEDHPLLSLLVNSAEDRSELYALRFILDAEAAVLDREQREAAEWTPTVPEGILVKREEGGQQNQISTDVRSRKVKKSTPERIRARAAKLYNEIHDLIDQYNVRKEREKFLSTGRRVEVSATPADNSAAIKPNNRSSRQLSSEIPSQVVDSHGRSGLPNLHQSFANARLKHLEQAEMNRSNFPLQHTTEFSTKDPSAFSMRFQQTAH